MRWEDERYVRLYTRDTTTWLMWSWQARFVFMSLLRKVDRAGMIDVGAYGLKGLSVALGVPLEIVDVGVAELLADGTIRQAGSMFVVPNFLHAQECSQSDKARQAAKRERDRAKALGHEGPQDDGPHGGVTQCDTESRNVTESHAESQPVTPSHTASLRTVPSVPSRADEDGAPAPVDSWGVLNRVRIRSKGRIDERLGGDREKAFAGYGARFTWPRLVADLDAICDVIATDEGLAFLKRNAEQQGVKFKPSLAAWMGPAEKGYPADALSSLAATCREWLARRAKAPTAAAPPAPTAPKVSEDQRAKVAEMAQAFIRKGAA
jgi:hypothetical protein